MEPLFKVNLYKEQMQNFTNKFTLYTIHSPKNALLVNLEEFKIYKKIHINIAPTCFGLQPPSGSLY
jgi:predicted P-loop ATPase